MSDKKKSSKKEHGVDHYLTEDGVNNIYKASPASLLGKGALFAGAGMAAARYGGATKMMRTSDVEEEPLTEAELELLDSRFAKEKALKNGLVEQYQPQTYKAGDKRAVSLSAFTQQASDAIQAYQRNYVRNPPIGGKSSYRSVSNMLNKSADVQAATVIDTDKAPAGTAFTNQQLGDILMDLLEQADIANDMLQVAMKQTQRLQALISEMVEYADSATENGDE